LRFVSPTRIVGTIAFWMGLKETDMDRDKKELRMMQSPYEVLAFDVLENPELPAMRALAFRTHYGAFLFALDRRQIEKIHEMLAEVLKEMTRPS
jgi:hypothetical protein